MRTIDYTVSLNSINPSTVQFAGFAGEDCVTKLHFEGTDDLSKAVFFDADAKLVNYLLEVRNSAGEYDVYPLALNTGANLNHDFWIPKGITEAGGVAAVQLSVVEVELDTETLVQKRKLFTYPVKLRFAQSAASGIEGEVERERYHTDVLSAMIRAEQAEGKANDHAAAAENYSDDAGEYAGNAAQSVIDAKAEASCAATSAREAERASTDAATSAESAEAAAEKANDHAAAAENYSDDAGEYAGNAAQSVIDAKAEASRAATSAKSAEAAAEKANDHAAAAENYSDDAGEYAGNAAQSVIDAKAEASRAATSAKSAEAAAEKANDHAAAAENYSDDAGEYAGNAAQSVKEAKAEASCAATSAREAERASTDAATSAESAGAAAENAALSAADAKRHADRAESASSGKEEWELIYEEETTEIVSKVSQKVYDLGDTSKGVRVALYIPPNTTLKSDRVSLAASLSGTNSLTVYASNWTTSSTQTLCVFDIKPKGLVWDIETAPYTKVFNKVEGNGAGTNINPAVRYVAASTGEPGFPAGTIMKIWRLM